MRIHYICSYCGHEWEDEVWRLDQANASKCVHCGDDKLRIKPIDNSDKIDYYRDYKWKK